MIKEKDRAVKVLVVQKFEGGSAAFGMSRLLAALVERGCCAQTAHDWQNGQADVVLCAGTLDSLYIRRMWGADTSKLCVPESLALRSFREGNMTVITAAGSDSNGLCYALLELAERVERGGLEGLEDLPVIRMSPDNRLRAVSRFVMSRRDDHWFYSEAFWDYYFQRLVACRFNRFVLIVGFDTAYLSPPYSFFVKVPGYPDVQTKDAQPDKNLAALRNIGRLCHNYGLKFELATWQQTPWTGEQGVLVTGLPEQEDALSDYCAAGLKELVDRCPEIDTVQLRVNFEAGIGGQATNNLFWEKLIYALTQTKRAVSLTLRAKGLTPELTAYAQELGIELTVATKYWCEHMALPYHIPVMRTQERADLSNYNNSRRYSYADMLTRPFRYGMIYRHWTYGSNTLFMWADQDYVRRFSRSIADGAGDGFEVTAPLSLKGGMSSVEGDDWPIFRDPAMRSGQWEDERYWPWYMCFGRIGYSRKDDGSAIRQAFLERFGERAALMEKAIAVSSHIMPLITTFHMPQHPSLQYWPEICTGAALFAKHNYASEYGDVSYGSALPSDEQMFCSVEDYVAALMQGSSPEKYSPLQVRDWLLSFSERAMQSLKDYLAGEAAPSSEALAAETDITMLCALARYHAWKITAAFYLARSRYQCDPMDIAQCLGTMRKALTVWEQMISTGEAYHDHMDFKAGSLTGKGKTGNWKDRLCELQADVSELEQMAGSLPEVQPQLTPHTSCADFCMEVPAQHKAGEDLYIRVAVGVLTALQGGLTLRHRQMNHLEGIFKEIPMQTCEGGFTAVISGKNIDSRWNLMLYVSGVDRNGNALIYPGVYSQANPYPYYIVKITDEASSVMRD